MLGNASRKFERKFDVELHGTDDDHELMAPRTASREASGWKKLIVRCQEFTLRCMRHRSIGILYLFINHVLYWIILDLFIHHIL